MTEVVQQARNLSSPIFWWMRFLIQDRDSKFTAAFDEVLRSEGIKVIPHAGATAPTNATEPQLETRHD